jgi:hypothetical protein
VLLPFAVVDCEAAEGSAPGDDPHESDPGVAIEPCSLASRLSCGYAVMNVLSGDYDRHSSARVVLHTQVQEARKWREV